MADLVSPQTADWIDTTAWRELGQVISQKIEHPTLTDVNTCSPLDITPYLNECRLFIEKRLRRMANAYPSLQWLWYLRRLPRFVFEGKINSTFGYDQTLAEVISGQGGHNNNKQTPPSTRRISYEISITRVQEVLRFCAEVRMLSQIHVLLRLAGKGCSFRFAQNEGLPRAIRNPEQDRAIQLYDNRVARYGQPFSRAGTVVSSIAHNPLQEDTILSVHSVANPSWAPSFMRSSGGELIKVMVFTQYVPRLMSLIQLMKLNTDPRLHRTRWLPTEVGAILLLLKMSFEMIMLAESGLTTIQQYGYFIAGEVGFKWAINELFPKAANILRKAFPNTVFPSSANELLRILKRELGEAWPLLPGPIIRRAGGGFCVDLQTATLRLDYLLEFPSVDGEMANARADHFEKATQETIDLSPWCPTKQLLKLRGVTLRHQGKPVTDIDAIGENDGTLLVVSCKSLVYSSRYDVGEYKVVRNAATTVEQAVCHWNDFRMFLEANCKGDNYDFSEYKRVLAVVCTPNPVYTLIGIATEALLPGLRVASSLNEFRNWLQKPNGVQ